jgi:hypothetical protein
LHKSSFLAKIEEIKIHLSKFKAGFEPIYTADEFVHIDDYLSREYIKIKIF